MTTQRGDWFPDDSAFYLQSCKATDLSISLLVSDMPYFVLGHMQSYGTKILVSVVRDFHFLDEGIWQGLPELVLHMSFV